MKYIIILSIFLAGCSIADKVAYRSLYPLNIANRTKVPDVPPAGVLSHFENGTHLWYSFDLYDTTVIYFHGNGQNIGSLHKHGFIEMFESLGVNFVIFDYPGYGLTEGAPSEASLTKSGRDAIRFAESFYDDNHIVVWGRSIGASVALLSALNHQEYVDSLILISPFDNFLNAARAKSSLANSLSDEFLAAHGYRSDVAATLFFKPVVILHGTIDKMISIDLGRALYEVFPREKTFIEVPGRGHNDIYQDEITSQVIREAVSQ